MPYITVPEKGHRLYYREYSPDKSGPPLVFLHGFTLDSRMWLESAEFFKDDYRVILPDAKGHGKSDAPKTGYSHRDRVEDVVALLDALEIEKAHVVGLSMGGVTAIGMALEYQTRLATLTLVSTSAAGYRLGGKFSMIDRLARTKGLEAARKKWMQISLGWYGEGQEALRESLEIQMREHSGAIWLDPMRGKYSQETDLEHVHRIAVPTMIVAGELDSVFVSVSEKLHERIINSSLSIFEGVGHMLNLETPTRFNDTLKVFLDSQKTRHVSR
jgi:3-oxoadipate enol-lactonase